MAPPTSSRMTTEIVCSPPRTRIWICCPISFPSSFAFGDGEVQRILAGEVVPFGQQGQFVGEDDAERNGVAVASLLLRLAGLDAHFEVTFRIAEEVGDRAVARRVVGG